MVAYVPNDIEEYSSAEDLAKKIILIEAEFSGQIQSVIKMISLWDYNKSTTADDIKYYGLTFKPTLNCQSWAIRRLMINE